VEVTGGPSDERVRELANEILSNPPFDAWNDSMPGALYRFLEWLAGFFTWMGRIYVDSPALYWLILTGFLLLAFALLGHIIWSTRIALRTPAPKAETVTIEVRPSWSKEASDFASEGRYLEAAHCLALGSVQSLVIDGHIDLNRSEANRILRNRIRSAALPEELSSEFLQCLDSFEARWFRDRAEDPDLYEAWRSLHSRISALPAQTR
jgi:hypothetical protein